MQPRLPGVRSSILLCTTVYVVVAGRCYMLCHTHCVYEHVTAYQTQSLEMVCLSTCDDEPSSTVFLKVPYFGTCITSIQTAPIYDQARLEEPSSARPSRLHRAVAGVSREISQDKTRKVEADRQQTSETASRHSYQCQKRQFSKTPKPQATTTASTLRKGSHIECIWVSQSVQISNCI